jgi:hypothetical protein
MMIDAHIEKFKRFDRLRSRFDPNEDFELWYWVSLNAGIALVNAALHASGVTRAHGSFTTQIPNVYSVAGPDSKRHLEYVFGVDIIHVGMPKIDAPLPGGIAVAFSEMEVIESFRDPCIREDRPITDDVIRTCSDAYDKCISAAKQYVNL